MHSTMETAVVMIATTKDCTMEDTRLFWEKTYFHHFRPHSWGKTAGAVYSLANASISMLSIGP